MSRNWQRIMDLAAVAEQDCAKREMPFINLAVGDPDLMPHVSVIEKLQVSSLQADANRYQNPFRIDQLNTAFASHYRKNLGVSWVEPSHVLPVFGAKDGVFLLTQLFANQTSAVACPNPGYFAYAAASKSLGLNPLCYALDSLTSSQNDIPLSKTFEEAKVVWTNFPNMPTGTSPCKKSLELLINNRPNSIVVNDNPYSMLAEPPFSIFHIKNARYNYLEVASLSKSHNMTGWRVGAVVGNSATIEKLRELYSFRSSGMYYPIEQAAIAALSLPSSWYAELRSHYRKRRIQTELLLTKLSCTVPDRQSGMYIWAAIPPTFRSCIEFSEFLLDSYGILVVPGVNFGSNGKRFIRVSLTADVESIRGSSVASAE